MDCQSYSHIAQSHSACCIMRAWCTAPCCAPAQGTARWVVGKWQWVLSLLTGVESLGAGLWRAVFGCGDGCCLASCLHSCSSPACVAAASAHQSINQPNDRPNNRPTNRPTDPMVVVTQGRDAARVHGRPGPHAVPVGLEFMVLEFEAFGWEGGGGRGWHWATCAA